LTRTIATVAATATAVSPVVPVFDASSLYTKKDKKILKIEVELEPITPSI
jgi:hypothetical protein